MKLINANTAAAALILSTVFGGVSANGNCLQTTTRCVDNNGGDCRDIVSGGPNCGKRRITISSQWCNNTNRDRTIFEDQGPALRLNGPAVVSHHGGPLTFSAKGLGRVLRHGECDEESWDSEIDTCGNFFNYQVNIFASNTSHEQCRGFNFARQMKTRCDLRSKINCTVLDGKNGGEGTPCEDYNPCMQPSGHSDGSSCLCEKQSDCTQNVRFDFEYQNANNSLNFRSTRQSEARVAWNTIANNWWQFRDELKSWEKKEWSITQWNVNVCERVPSASLELRGDLIDSDTNEIDENFSVCMDRVNRRNRNFPRLHFCDGRSEL